MKQISILGCGWLGLPLAQKLLADKHRVKGSTTTASKIETLASYGIISCLINLDHTGVNLDQFLNGSDILIINVPPNLRQNASQSYSDKMGRLIPFIEQSKVSRVLFVGATSIYADDNTVVTEETQPIPQTESSRQLLEAEHLLKKNNAFKTTILRFGGLIGGNRHPVKYLSGRIGLENADAPVNLIHLEDCIGIIQKIIDDEVWGETFNAAYPNHPKRKDYYTNKAIDLQLPLPVFESGNSFGKIISSEQIERQLGYNFHRPI
ncbi:MAG TPA: SDR family oxidoreductase [Flavobacterium sp.]|jgi:nucleoside-diphosphate-sugar epimerase